MITYVKTNVLWTKELEEWSVISAAVQLKHYYDNWKIKSGTLGTNLNIKGNSFKSVLLVFHFLLLKIYI